MSKTSLKKDAETWIKNQQIPCCNHRKHNIYQTMKYARKHNKVVFDTVYWLLNTQKVNLTHKNLAIVCKTLCTPLKKLKKVRIVNFYNKLFHSKTSKYIAFTKPEYKETIWNLIDKDIKRKGKSSELLEYKNTLFKEYTDETLKNNYLAVCVITDGIDEAIYTLFENFDEIKNSLRFAIEKELLDCWYREFKDNPKNIQGKCF
ncbi:hypothetical protein H9M94_02820 [Mycoplasma sp. Pen4]|uniref:hypothetical protein n=2 Tax=Mycoplasma sp. Pen4 TaxID=640330 RepID=UPI001654332A|nr:hypothetical protein [Mycoplasma sp. Pen4]QNM93519.1 hypothetical protein H9M94_02820 [Mycoplasma sp. Pen4]